METTTSALLGGRRTVWLRAHPVVAYFGLTFAISWTLWIPWALGDRSVPAQLLFLLGGFGPFAAASLVTYVNGGSVRAWIRSMLGSWRVPARYYAYALGLPVALFAAVNAVLAATGQPVDLGALPGRIGPYVATLVFVAIVGGGLEEPGWRGFALPRLQEHFSPTKATFIVGLVWGIWHIPAYGTPLAFAVPLVLAFFYTWLYNRTGSVVLCVLLHGSFTPAFGLVLAPDSLAVDAAIFGTLVAAAALLTVVTRRRLGTRAEAPV
jgi:uncharacterized protein